MNLAIQSARFAVQHNEGGPFGACIAQGERVIAVAHNTVLKEGDPTCHAELNAIRLAAKNLATHHLSSCTLFTTAEPCPMCLGAIYWARIPTVIVGLSKEQVAHYGFDDDLFYKRLKKIHLKETHLEYSHGDCEDSHPNFEFVNKSTQSDCEEVFKLWQTLGRVRY